MLIKLSTTKRRREAYTSFWWGNLRGKRTLGRPRRRWEDNIKMDIQEMECGGTYWIQLARDEDRWRELMNAVMKFQVP